LFAAPHPGEDADGSFFDIVDDFKKFHDKACA